MPFFEYSINNSDQILVGAKNLKLLEIGVLSVGPDFDIDFLSNGVKEGEQLADIFVNQRVYVGDKIDIIYKPEISNENEQGISNSIHTLDKKYGDKKNQDKIVRCFKLNGSHDVRVTTSTVNNFTLCITFIWHINTKNCYISLGNTDYQGNEQWMKIQVIPEKMYSIKIE